MGRDWESYYAKTPDFDFTADPLLLQVAEMIPSGTALDLACGHGRNALCLAALGWQVTAVDSSASAIAILRRRAQGLAIDARVADLELGEFTIAPDTFDLICDFYYLQRDLFPQIRQGVKPGGVFAGAILLGDPAADSGPHNPAFVLNPGELREEFAGWKIFFCSEAAEPGRTHRSARILARKA